MFSAGADQNASGDICAVALSGTWRLGLITWPPGDNVHKVQLNSRVKLIISAKPAELSSTTSQSCKNM